MHGAVDSQNQEAAPSSTSLLDWVASLQPKSRQVREGRAEHEPPQTKTFLSKVRQQSPTRAAFLGNLLAVSLCDRDLEQITYGDLSAPSHSGIPWVWSELLSSSMELYVMSSKHGVQIFWLYIFPCAIPVKIVISVNCVHIYLVYPVSLYHWSGYTSCVSLAPCCASLLRCY